MNNIVQVVTSKELYILYDLRTMLPLTRGSLSIRQFSRICRGCTFSTSNKTKPKVSLLDLHNSGLSAIERLCLEEALLRHDPLQRSWAILGMHDPTYNTYLRVDDSKGRGRGIGDENSSRNENCIIIMGIGGKPDKLLNVEKVKQDNVLTIKRFSGGGTVVIDHSSLWTTFIGRKEHFPHVDPYPRSIMEWSAEHVFDPVFRRMKEDVLNRHSLKQPRRNLAAVQTPRNFTPGVSVNRRSLVMDNKSCGLAQGSGDTVAYTSASARNSKDVPDFSLRENDYVLGERKMGGNAQSITGTSWIHHTSFLWDFDDENMEYLTLPQKRPDYRGDRQHEDFLVKLKSVYGGIGMDDTSSRRSFLNNVRNVAIDTFEVEEATLRDALDVVDELGGMQAWFDGKCRTRILDL